MARISEEISSINFGSIIGGSLNAIVEAQSQAAHTTVDFIKQVGFHQEEDNTSPVYVKFKYMREVSPYQPRIEDRYTVVVEKSGNGYIAGDFDITLNDEIIPCNVEITGGGISSVSIQNPEIKLDESSKLSIVAKSSDIELPSGDNEAKLKVTKIPGREAEPAKMQKMVLEVPILTMVPIPFIRIDDATIDFNVKINSVTTTNSSSDFSYGGSLESSAGYNGWRFKASVKLNATLANQKHSDKSDEIKKDYSLNIHIRAVQDDMPAGVERLLNILEEATNSYPEDKKEVLE